MEFIDPITGRVVVVDADGHARLSSGPEPAIPDSRAQAVYLVEGGGRFKIGISADPAARLASLQTGSPFLLRLVCSREFADAAAVERELHMRMGAHRIHGEWFDLPPRALADVQAVLGA